MKSGTVTTSHNGNGFTQKEMLNLILEGQNDINKRIDELHEKVNQKLSRQELTGWLVAISALVVLINSVI
mgnify:CR=1 FL=1